MRQEKNVENSHLSALRTKHSDLESRIAQEAGRPQPDEFLIHALKKRKLALKDAMVEPRPH